MKKIKYLFVVLSALVAVNAFAQDYGHTYYVSDYYHKDSIYYKDAYIPKAEFMAMVRAGKIRIDQGDRIGDSCWLSREKKFMYYEDYNNKYYWETSMMPSVGYQLYMPKNSDSLGTFSGVSIGFLFWGKYHDEPTPGPCMDKFYGKISIMSSSKTNLADMLNYSLGLTLSLEKNPKRNWLVPYFGAETGWFNQKQIGSVFYVNPIAGIQFIANKNVFFGAYGGYLYPFNKFDMVRGYTAQASVEFSFW